MFAVEHFGVTPEVADIDQCVDGRQRLVPQHPTDQRFNGRPKLTRLRAKGAIGISPRLDAGMLRHLLDTQPAADGLLGITQHPDQVIRRWVIGHVMCDDDTPHVAGEAPKEIRGDRVG